MELINDEGSNIGILTIKSGKDFDWVTKKSRLDYHGIRA